MKQEVLAYAVEQTKAMMSAPSCNAETKTAAQAWLAAIGTEKEPVATKQYLADLESCIMPIDGLIAFAGSEAGAQVFGAELAKNILAHAEEIKAQGAKYCDCPACAAAANILSKKAEMLA